MLRGRPLTDAIEAAERLRRKFAELRLATLGQAVRFTCSFGVSEWRDGENIDDLLKRADVALYGAKKTGRNRVVADDAALSADDRASAKSVVRLATR